MRQAIERKKLAGDKEVTIRQSRSFAGEKGRNTKETQSHGEHREGGIKIN
jgi:hypothetical protein